MKKTVVAMGMVLALAFPVFGTGSTEPAAQQAEEKQVMIAIWRHQQPALEDFFKNVIAEYKKVRPDVEVVYESIGINDLDHKLQIAIAAKEAPAMTGLYDVQFNQFYEKGLLAPVDVKAMGFSSVNALLEEMYVAGSMDLALKNGKLYAAGWESNVNWAVSYNKDCFDAAGVPYLSEQRVLGWDEYFELAGKLTLREGGKMVQMGDGMYLSAMDNPDGARFILDPMFRQFGGIAFNEKTYKPLNRAAWIKVAQAIYDAGPNGKLAYVDPGFPTATNAQTEMFADRVAMCMSGFFADGWGKRVNPEIRLGFAPYPALSPERDEATTYGHIYVVFNQVPEEQQLEAWKFYAFLTNEENTRKLFMIKGNVVPRKIPGYQEFVLETSPNMRVFFRDAPRAVSTVYGEHGAEAWGVIKKMTENIMLNDLKPEEAVDRSWAELERIQ